MCVCGEVMCSSCMAHLHEPHGCWDNIERTQGEDALARAHACNDLAERESRAGDWREP